MWNYQIEENILYEDKEILVCRKTAGMPVQAAKIGTMDMESALKNYLAQKTPGKIPYLGVVHRLDQPVEGILVFAKTSEAAGNLSKQMMAGGAGKYYLAVTEGKAKSSEGILTDYLKKNGKANMSQVVSANTPGAKKAILHYKVLDQQEINGNPGHFLRSGWKQVGIIRSVCSFLMRDCPFSETGNIILREKKVHHWDFVPVVWNLNTPEQEK